MAEEFVSATFHVPGSVDAARLSRILSLINLHYVSSAWLDVYRYSDAPSSSSLIAETANYLSYILPYSTSDRYQPYRRSSSRSGLNGSQIDILNELFDPIVRAPGVELLITGVELTGSLNIDTSGVGRPLKELIRSIFSRKQRAEDLRHAKEMNQRAERQSDFAFHQQQQDHVLSTLERIHDLTTRGVINQPTATLLTEELLPVRAQVELEIRTADIEYVEGTVADDPSRRTQEGFRLG